jgi:hypothetical protein
MIRVAIGLLLVSALSVACTASQPLRGNPGPRTSDPIQTTDQPTRSKASASNYAADCIKANRSARQRFDRLIYFVENPWAYSDGDITNAYLDQMEQIMLVLSLDGMEMLVEIERRGPVRKGDECLYGSAVALDGMKNFFPPRSEGYNYAADAAQTYFEAILRHYPESSHAADPEDALESF